MAPVEIQDLGTIMMTFRGDAIGTISSRRWADWVLVSQRPWSSTCERLLLLYGMGPQAVRASRTDLERRRSSTLPWNPPDTGVGNKLRGLANKRVWRRRELFGELHVEVTTRR